MAQYNYGNDLVFDGGGFGGGGFGDIQPYGPIISDSPAQPTKTVVYYPAQPASPPTYTQSGKGEWGVSQYGIQSPYLSQYEKSYVPTTAPQLESSLENLRSIGYGRGRAGTSPYLQYLMQQEAELTGQQRGVAAGQAQQSAQQALEQMGMYGGYGTGARERLGSQMASSYAQTLQNIAREQQARRMGLIGQDMASQLAYQRQVQQNLPGQELAAAQLSQTAREFNVGEARQRWQEALDVWKSIIESEAEKAAAASEGYEE